MAVRIRSKLRVFELEHGTQARAAPEGIPWRKIKGICLLGLTFMILSWNKDRKNDTCVKKY